MYTLNDYVDISRVIEDSSYAKNMGLIVKSQKIKSVKDIENKLKAIPSDDPDWREKVMSLKRDLAEAKQAAGKRLHVIKYNKNSLNSTNISTLGLFRSVITDGSRVVSFAPPKSYSIDDFMSLTEHNTMDNLEFSDFVEGTMINMFVNPITNEWEIATRSNIGARCKFYQDNDSTFRQMFLEAFSKKQYEFSMFDRSLSYSWVLQHPDNKIVNPIASPNIVLTHIFAFNDVTEKDGNTTHMVEDVLDRFNRTEFINTESKIHTPEEHPEKPIHEYIQVYKNGQTDYRIMGTVVRDTITGARTKIRNDHYEYVKNLKGNSPKLQYRYYHLRQLNAVKDYLKYYPEDRPKFSKFRDQMHKFTETLWRNYMRCYVHKEKPLKEFSFEYRSHMYQLHQFYINNLRADGGRIDKLATIQYVNSLKPGYLMHSINYPLKKRSTDEIGEVIKEKVEELKLEVPDETA